MTNSDITFIDRQDDLSTLCDKLRGCSWLAVDTEFERTNTYYPELCLLQFGNNDMTAIVDPLAITDLTPLYKVLYDPAITLVFHAARQDLEIFFHIHNDIPTPLFDTQIAAGLLGYDDQVGYANLVKEELQVELAKSETRTNWKKRPLTDKQLHYAADDVIYLSQLYTALQNKLTKVDLLSEHDTQCHGLTQAEIYEPDPETLWQKINSAKKFHGAQFTVLKKLAAWREITARAENLPRKWVLSNQALVQMARYLPEDADELAAIKGMNKKSVKRYGNDLLEIIQHWGKNNSDTPA